MDQINKPRTIRLRRPDSYPQIREASRITEFCNNYTTYLHNKPTNDPELKNAMCRLVDSEPSRQPGSLLLLSSIMLDKALNSNPRWINGQLGQLLAVSTALHVRQARSAEENGRFNIAAREYWVAGNKVDVIRVYQIWANRDRDRGNIREAKALQEMLDRGTHPLDTPAFYKDTIPEIAKKLLISAKRKE